MIELKNDHKEVKRGDIFWYAIEDTIIPVIVIQNDIGNKYSQDTIVIKMSASNNVALKNGKIPTIVPVFKEDIIFKNTKNHLADIGYILTSSIFTIPKSSLKHYIGRIQESKFSKIEAAIQISLGLNPKAYIV